MNRPDVARSPLFSGSQFLRLALDGVVLAYVAGALFVIALEFRTAAPSLSLTSGVVLGTAFALLEAVVIADVLQIFKTILR
jgi:ABC-type uncharacterized transport system permease subunit